MIGLAGVAAAAVVAGFAARALIGRRQWRHKAEALAARRANLTREGFIAALAGETDAATAAWLWATLLPHFAPLLTPGPDDDLRHDLPIDRDEPEDWVRNFCKRHGLRPHDLGPCPAGEAVTARTLARWLTTERQRLQRP